ncbi:MAG: cell division protein FtsH [Gemmataceae bacterium]|nr:cell division protein FtsH [Gemmataceae bacterium]
MTFSPDEIATAYHEAGHAVMALVLGRPVQRVSIEPNHLRLGHCAIKKGTFRPSGDPLETEILFMLGGPAAEARHVGEYSWDAAAQDLRGVRALTTQRTAGERQAERLEQRLLAKTEHILNRPGVWTAVERIVEELLRCTTISGRAARHLFEHATAEAAGNQ